MSETETESVTSVTGGDGNTKNPRGKLWCFTINNYTDEEVFELKAEKVSRLTMQSECGEEGTHHLQGYIAYKNAIRFETLKKRFPRAHWERCRNKNAAIAYCKKDDTFDGVLRYEFGGPRVPIDFWEDRGIEWQNEILDICASEADLRTVHWFWEDVGNVGKTTLAFHICGLYPGAIYVSGRAADIKNAIATMIDKGKWPSHIIWDIVRSSEEYVSYGGIEQIKNRIFFSGKYEAAMCRFDPVHVIILANFPPIEEKLSCDRWHVRHIE